jgi:NADH:ubiquinone oxidoreductase subunit 6 (subunit J)
MSETAGLWVCWSFAGIAILAGTFAALASDMKRAILSLWVAGLAVGGLYLTLGAELLAIVQWIVSTVSAISFFFFSVIFGQYRSTEQGRQWPRMVGAITTGAAVAGVLGWSSARMSHGFAADAVTQLVPESDLVSLGKLLTGSHFLALEILAVLLFMVLIGAGVIARPDELPGTFDPNKENTP